MFILSLDITTRLEVHGFFPIWPMKQLASRCQVKKSWMPSSLILDSRSDLTGNAIWNLEVVGKILHAHRKHRFCGCSWCSEWGKIHRFTGRDESLIQLALQESPRSPGIMSSLGECSCCIPVRGFVSKNWWLESFLQMYCIRNTSQLAKVAVSKKWWCQNWIESHDICWTSQLC